MLFYRFLTSVKYSMGRPSYLDQMISPEKELPPTPCPVLSAADKEKASHVSASISNKETETTIDVRGLEAPRPLVHILTLLESPDMGDTLVVIHDRDPVLLYPELQDRGWTWTKLSAPEGELHLRLSRKIGAES